MRKFIKRVAMSGNHIYDNLYTRSIWFLDFWYLEMGDVSEYTIGGKCRVPIVRIDERGWHNTIKELLANWVARVADEGECEVLASGGLACDFLESVRKVGPLEFVHNRTAYGYCSCVVLFLCGREIFGLDAGD